jgi:hypothetical protein
LTFRTGRGARPGPAPAASPAGTSPLARNRQFSSVSASMSQPQAAVFTSTAQGLTRTSCTPLNRSRHPHARPPDRSPSPGTHGTTIRHTAEPASSVHHARPCPGSGEPSASPIEPHRALMNVRNMDLDCSQVMQGDAGPRHKPRLHRGAALLSASPPHAKVAFQRCALQHLTHMADVSRCSQAQPGNTITVAKDRG